MESWKEQTDVAHIFNEWLNEGPFCWKSSCSERTCCMQHHISSGVGGITKCAIAISFSEAASACPAVSAKMTWCSASFFICNFEYDEHFPTGFALHSMHIFIYLSQTDLRSSKMTLIPFTFPLSARLGWSSEKHIFCTWPRMSSSLGASSGLLSGITVLHSFLCIPP